MTLHEASGVATLSPGGVANVKGVLFKKDDPNAIIPTRAHDTDAGFDLHALYRTTIPSGGRAVVNTGVSVAIPYGFVGLVSPRSGLAAKHGITVTNAPGIVDSGYRGEIMVILQNTGDRDFNISPGDRIAQLVVTQFLGLGVEVDELPPADRGTAGFGSTGV